MTRQKTAPRENSNRVGAVGLESFQREWTGFRNEMRQEDSPLGRSAFRVADDTVVVRQIGVKPWRIFPPRTEVLPRPGLRPATLRGCSSRSPMTLTRLFSSMEIRLMRR